ncbi:amidophosphoribosyltransferase [Clostridia bacterium]|nr:amidophosphoribosyltransferase [Clostridia bacterium]
MIKEECGVFGIYTNEPTDVAAAVYHGLYTLQHRGQESCGIVVNHNGVFNYLKGLGLVGDTFDEDKLHNLKQGRIAVGHVRYSTTGALTSHNTQPMVVRHVKGPLAIAHNGNLINANELREHYELKGAIFHSTSDTETIAYAVTEHRLKYSSIEAAVARAVTHLQGAFSLVIMSARKLVLARDPWGFRPLCVGELPADGIISGGGYVAASESCALTSLGAKFLFDVLPGEIVTIDSGGLKRFFAFPPEARSRNLCVFEYVYFARPDSIIDGVCVHEARIQAGRLLAREHPCDADIVIGVPDSGIDAALGYSRESGIPYDKGFIKNRYIGRTFIQPSQKQRLSSVRLKLNVIRNVVAGKRVLMVDDSIVRGTTTGEIVKLLRDAGATEVHVRISCPPFMHPCFFGTDIDSRENLIACRMTMPEITKHLNADSLGYLSVDGVRRIGGCDNDDAGLCCGCFTGEYPLDVPDAMPKDKFEQEIL